MALMAIGAALSPFPLMSSYPKFPTARRSVQRVGTSKHMPHQGEQEKARRRRQLAEGKIRSVSEDGATTFPDKAFKEMTDVELFAAMAKWGERVDTACGFAPAAFAARQCELIASIGQARGLNIENKWPIKVG